MEGPYIQQGGFEVWSQAGNDPATLHTNSPSLTEAAHVAEYLANRGQTSFVVALERRVVESFEAKAKAKVA